MKSWLRTELSLPRRWLRFSLRAALFLSVPSAVFFAWVGNHFKSYERQHEAAERISTYTFNFGTKPGNPRWLRPFADPRVFGDVTRLTFDPKIGVSDRDLAPLELMPCLAHVDMAGTAIGD